MKKLISILMIVAVLAAVVMVSAFAAETPQVVVESTTAAPGDEIVLAVSLVNNPGITNGKITVEFDNTALEFVEIDVAPAQTAGFSMALTNPAQFNMNFMTPMDAIAGDFTLFTVKFNVLEEAEEGEYEVNLVLNKMVDGNNATVEFEVVKGIVTVSNECRHENLIHFEAIEPACHFEGNVEYWFCPDCECVWTDEALTMISNLKSVILPELGGEVVHVEAKEPTCMEEGNIEHWYCEECEQVWADEALTQLTNRLNVILPVAEHNLVHMEAIAPGCHFEGQQEHWYCTVCGTVWADEALTQITNHMNVIIPALGGEVVHVEAKEPTCMEEGNIEHWYCEECECVWADEALTQLTNRLNVILPVAEHKIVHVEAKEPTCMEEGNIEHWYCTVCEVVWQDEALTQITNHLSVKLGLGEHNIVHMEAVEPGCHYEGHIEHWYCTVCECVWADEALTQQTNHMSVIIPELGGEVEHVEAKTPTCMEEGNIEYWYCEECEQFWTDEALTKLTNSLSVKLGLGEHNIVHMEAVEPGCHYEGLQEHWYCTVCDTVWADEALTQITNHMNVIIPELGGEVEHVEAKDPTCTENGNIEHWYCEECEKVWQDEALTQLTNRLNVVLAAHGHNYVDGVCSICGNAQTGDFIYVAVATALVSMMGIVALTKKKEF